MKINIGCGKDLRKGWVNLDCHDSNGADFIFDLNEVYKGICIPVEDDSFDYVYCSHVIEDFVDPVPLIKEFVRIAKKGGIIDIRVPHETNAWSNIHHKRAFNLNSFGALVSEDYGEKLPVNLKSEFYATKGFISLIVAKVLNKIPNFLIYCTPIKYLFPGTNVKYILKKSLKGVTI